MAQGLKGFLASRVWSLGLKASGTPSFRITWRFMGSYLWSCKFQHVGYKYTYPGLTMPRGQVKTPLQWTNLKPACLLSEKLAPAHCSHHVFRKIRGQCYGDPYKRTPKGLDPVLPSESSWVPVKEFKLGCHNSSDL